MTTLDDLNASQLELSVIQFQRILRALFSLYRWYETNKRDLPWRHTRDPYAIWVSEVMLQQTQVATVRSYYHDWMQAFPDVQTLAMAKEQQLLRVIEGVGYYRRFQNLHRAAAMVCTQYGGAVPSDATQFSALPGVGPYTTAAVMSIAFDQRLAVLDGNVRRVLSRLVALAHDDRQKIWSDALQRLAQDLMPEDEDENKEINAIHTATPGEHNQALMELGAMICRPRDPKCDRCPLQSGCCAYAHPPANQFPSRQKRPPLPHYEVVIGIVFKNGLVFIDQRPYGGLLGGLWEFPGGKIKPNETEEEALHRELTEEFGLHVRIGQKLPAVKHAYSHFRVTLHPYVCEWIGQATRAAEGAPWRFISCKHLTDYPMPRANRKIIAELLTPAS